MVDFVTLADIRDIKESPIIGKGLLKQTRFDRQENWDSFNKPYRNLNSWTDTWVRLGSIGFILFMSWYIISLRKYSLFTLNSEKGWIIIFGSLLITLASQPILFTPVFTSLIYIGFYNSPIELLTYSPIY